MVCDNRNRGVYGKESRVLILILLEYGLRPRDQVGQRSSERCLNPYSIGIWSATSTEAQMVRDLKLS